MSNQAYDEFRNEATGVFQDLSESAEALRELLERSDDVDDNTVLLLRIAMDRSRAQRAYLDRTCQTVLAKTPNLVCEAAVSGSGHHIGLSR